MSIDGLKQTYTTPPQKKSVSAVAGICWYKVEGITVIHHRPATGVKLKMCVDLVNILSSNKVKGIKTP